MEKGMIESTQRDVSNQLAKNLWQGNLTTTQQQAVNQICSIYELDPLLKQIVVLGGNFYITKAGVRQIAERSEHPPLSIEVTPATEQERKDSRVPEDSHLWKATVKKYRTKDSEQLVFTEYGEASIKNVNLNTKDWRTLSDMAKTRAVNRALRNAYSIGLTSIEEISEAPHQTYAEVIPKSNSNITIPNPATESTQTHTNAPNLPELSENVPEPFEVPEEANTGNSGEQDTRLISEAQRKRLFAITKQAGYDQNELKAYLDSVWGLGSTRDIPRHAYEIICNYVQEQKT